MKPLATLLATSMCLPLPTTHLLGYPKKILACFSKDGLRTRPFHLVSSSPSLALYSGALADLDATL